MAGHSKWAQIKHKKAATDAERGRQFGKLSRDITIAARAGGGNPVGNPRLRSAVDRARAAGMPKDNILRAISRSRDAGGALAEFLIEALAPNDVMLIIEGETDNKNRLLAELKQILAAAGARLTDPGAVMWNFSKVCAYDVAPGDPALDREQSELTIAGSGAEDFAPSENGWTVHLRLADAKNVQQKLAARGFRVEPAGYSYTARTIKELTPDAEDRLARLLSALENHHDVRSVHTNARLTRKAAHHIGD